jgi:hypothetical protein
MVRPRIANPFHVGSSPIANSIIGNKSIAVVNYTQQRLTNRMVVIQSLHELRNQVKSSLKIWIVYAPIVYRLGRCPFKAERGVRFPLGVPY